MGQIDTIKDVLGTEFVYSKTYYNNVFKKTEKIISAVFFIFQRQENTHDIKDVDTLTTEIKKTALGVLALLSETLLEREGSAHVQLLEVTRLLLLLNSYVAVAMASGSIAPAYGSIISAEISSVLESVRELEGGMHSLPKARIVASTERKERVHTAVENSAQSVEGAVGQDRKERIVAIVREKGQVSIKDISDIIKDVSEKSIQRDLNSLIEKGQIIRQGERRWSTYSLTV